MSLLNRFVSRVARGKSSTATISPTSIDQVQVILDAYSRVLERFEPAPGTVVDASRLPYPKDTIEAAILFALRIAENEGLRSNLRQAFVELAHFQDGVGSAGRGSGGRASSSAQAPSSEATPQGDWATVYQSDRDRLTRRLQEAGHSA